MLYVYIPKKICERGNSTIYLIFAPYIMVLP